eukprot:scaffold59824_cov33-Tisochrysis_lutea.AAC.2
MGRTLKLWCWCRESCTKQGWKRLIDSREKPDQTPDPHGLAASTTLAASGGPADNDGPNTNRAWLADIS